MSPLENESANFLTNFHGNKGIFSCKSDENKNITSFLYKGYTLYRKDLPFDWTMAVGEIMNWATKIDEGKL